MTWRNVLFLVLSGCGVSGASAPYFHTHAVARVEARVDRVCAVAFPAEPSGLVPSQEGEEAATREVQIISLEVKAVEEFTGRDPDVTEIVVGDTLEITSPIAAELPPFQVGDRIGMRIRLVAPAEDYDPENARKEWWFYPEGEGEDPFPPRHPFKSVTVLGSVRSE